MPKTKISEYSATANSNTDVASINIDEGCAPSGINNAIRAVMGHLKDFQQGTNGDPFNGPVNGTVGATTPSTGAFTTLSASSTVTLSGGTANGVAYLNGSKVLTTGSALTFDGSRLAIGTATSNIQLTTTVNTNQAYISLADADGRTAVFRGPNSGSPNCAQIGTTTNHETSFLYGGAEVMRLTGTSLYTASGINVGIGTSLPGQPLHVSKNQNASTWAYVSNTTAGTGSAAGFLFASDVVTGAIQAVSSLNTGVGNNNSLWIRTTGAYPITLGTNSTVQMTLDSSGNLIQKGATTASGVKPSALANNESISTVNSATYTITLGTSAKLFWISLGNGDAALVFTSYLSSSITFLGITPTNIVASASPTSAQLGISKSANSHDIVIKTGSALASTAAAWQMGVLSSTVA